MSLRQFHIVFILFSLALMGFTFTWSMGMFGAANAQSHEVLAAVSACGFIAGAIYLVWFLKKIKT